MEGRYLDDGSYGIKTSAPGGDSARDSTFFFFGRGRGMN